MFKEVRFRLTCAQPKAETDLRKIKFNDALKEGEREEEERVNASFERNERKKKRK